MSISSEQEQDALKLAEIIEDAVSNPEKAVKRMDEKTGAKSILGTIFEFIKDYKNKDKDQSDADWIKQQYAKPEYASAWEGADSEKRRDEAAQGIVNGIEDYENAKKSLKTHIELGGTRASWLAEQIEIGAANNGKDPAEYAREISNGLDEAKKENRDFLLGSNLIKEDK